MSGPQNDLGAAWRTFRNVRSQPIRAFPIPEMTLSRVDDLSVEATMLPPNSARLVLGLDADSANPEMSDARTPGPNRSTNRALTSPAISGVPSIPSTAMASTPTSTPSAVANLLNLTANPPASPTALKAPTNLDPANGRR